MFHFSLPHCEILLQMLCIDCGIVWWSLDLLECRIYTTNVEMALRLTIGTLQIQLEHWFCHHQLSHYTQSRTFFYLWRSREWLTLSSVLEIVHYYDVCPFTIFFSGPSWLYGSWIYNYLCNHCLSFHHLCCEFEFWFPPPIKLTSTIYRWIYNKCLSFHHLCCEFDITEILLKVAFNTMTIILTIFSFFKTTSINSRLDFARSNLR
jgi:hypothetical protein